MCALLAPPSSRSASTLGQESAISALSAHRVSTSRSASRCAAECTAGRASPASRRHDSSTGATASMRSRGWRVGIASGPVIHEAAGKALRSRVPKLVPDMSREHCGADRPRGQPPHEARPIGHRRVQRSGSVADDKVHDTGEDGRTNPRFATRRIHHVWPNSSCSADAVDFQALLTYTTPLSAHITPQARLDAPAAKPRYPLTHGSNTVSTIN